MYESLENIVEMGFGRQNIIEDCMGGLGILKEWEKKDWLDHCLREMYGLRGLDRVSIV